MKSAANSFVFIIIFCFTSLCKAEEDPFIKLELLQVLFRHGDRVPDLFEVYPTDPHNPQEYENIGYGELTKVGKLRMYNLGQVLRKKYDAFLGDYRFNKVHAFSTHLNRTIDSLHAVLAGLYATNSNNLSFDSVKIDFNFPSKLSKDKFCPKYSELFEEAKKSLEISSRLDKYQEFIKYLNNATKENISDPTKSWKLYNNIRAGMSMNLSRPHWCTNEAFKSLEDLLAIKYDGKSLYEVSKRINAGPIIENILVNIQSSNKKIRSERKIYLYSGHDHNIAAFARAHNFTNFPRIPDFGSAVIVEKLRGKDDEIYLRMFYWTGVTEEMIPLEFRNFGTEITVKLYGDMIKSLIPRDDDCI